MSRAIINKRGLRKLVPLSDATIWRLEQADEFPRRIRLTDAGAVGWYLDEVEKWIEERVRSGGKRVPTRRRAANSASEAA
jgi:prophage regulatory protein